MSCECIQAAFVDLLLLSCLSISRVQRFLLRTRVCVLVINTQYMLLSWSCASMKYSRKMNLVANVKLVVKHAQQKTAN